MNLLHGKLTKRAVHTVKNPNTETSPRMYRCLNPYLGQILNQTRNRKGEPLEHCRFSIPDGDFFVSVKSHASLIERYNKRCRTIERYKKRQNRVVLYTNRALHETSRQMYLSVSKLLIKFQVRRKKFNTCCLNRNT